MLFYRIYQCIVMIPLVVVLTILTASSIIVVSLLRIERRSSYIIAKCWARLFCALTWVRVEVHGRENIAKGHSYIFVANHQGAYDIFAIYGYLGHNFRWMMKKALERIPFVGVACRLAGHIYVDSSSPKAIKQTMDTAEKRLAGGLSVVVFPEGTRSADGRLKNFKRGAYILADHFNLPVVPVTIDGAYRVMPRNARLPRPGRIVLTIHPAITAGAEGHDVPALIKQSRDAIASALPEAQR